MSTPQAHQLTIVIEPASLGQLIALGVNLYAFLGFRSSNRTGAPLVVQAVTQLSASMNIGWTETYQGFVSRTLLSDGVDEPAKRTIKAASSSPVRLAQALTVTSTFELAPSPDGADGAVTFRQSLANELTCGLAYGDAFAPACAATLVSGVDVVIEPVQLVYLMLSSSQFDVGAWVAASSGQGLLVDMTGVDARTVTFDNTVPNAWREADQEWAQSVPPGRSLTDLLRQSPQRNLPRT